MHLEVVSPEAVLFSSEVDAVTVPGKDGAFQMLNNHAAIVSILKEGTIKINMHNQKDFDTASASKLLVPSSEDAKVLTLAISSGTLELNDNKAIILVD